MRSTNLAFTATTLAALVAMAAGAPGLRAASVGRLAPTQATAAMSEAEAVRVVAAVVAAAARDLLAGQCIAAVLPETMDDHVLAVSDRIPSIAPASRRPLTFTMPPGLLDLPPPSC